MLQQSLWAAPIKYLITKSSKVAKSPSWGKGFNSFHWSSTPQQWLIICFGCYFKPDSSYKVYNNNSPFTGHFVETGHFMVAS